MVVGRRRRNFVCFIAVAVAVLGTQDVSAAVPADWSSIEQRIVKLFYPGQSSYQWLRGKEHKKAFNKVRDGDSCVSCHEEEEEDLGAALAKEGRLEPMPVDAKNGSVDLLVQAAHDEENVYMRFQWKTAEAVPGTNHTHYRFDGKEWISHGGSKLHRDVQGGKQPALYEDRLALMIDDGKVPMFAEQGCWITCHDGMVDMKREASQQAIDSHPLLGNKIHATEVRKYLPASRADKRATWSKTRSEEDIAQLMADGGFVDLMQWRGHRTSAVSMADDGYVLEYRHNDEGQNIFARNWDRQKNQPLYMFDVEKVGFRAKTESELKDPSKPAALIVETNAITFDPDAEWKEGDLIPQYHLTRTGASGSAADNQSVNAQWKDGTWTVEWTRKLNTGNPDDKILNPGGVIVVGFAVHDDNISSRGHFVSFPITLGFGDGTGADLTSRKLIEVDAMVNVN
jgi:hypothetical protein